MVSAYRLDICTSILGPLMLDLLELSLRKRADEVQLPLSMLN